MTTLAYPLPRQYPITRGFADTSITKVKSFGGLGAHTGLDLGAPCGVPVLAAGPAIVTRVINGAAALLNAGGRQIRITHSDSLTSEYLHLSVIYVREGQVVGAGAVIGSVGSSGAATGCHLHFQVNLNGQPIDPGPYIGLGATQPGGATATLAGATTAADPNLYRDILEWLTSRTEFARGKTWRIFATTAPAGFIPRLTGADILKATDALRITDQLVDPADFPRVATAMVQGGAGQVDVGGFIGGLVFPPLLEAGLNLAILGTAALLIYSGIRQATSAS